MIITKASARYLRYSAQKARLVVNQIRKLSINNAITVLTFSHKRSAKDIKKILLSAIANAEENSGLDVDDLLIHRIYVDEGNRIRRHRARAKGRAGSIIKRTCHITVELCDTSIGEKK